MIKILLTAVAANEVGIEAADGQFCHQNQHLLPFVKYFPTKSICVGRLLAYLKVCQISRNCLKSSENDSITEQAETHP